MYRGQLAGQDAGHGLVQQRQALVDLPLGDQGAPLQLHPHRRQVRVAEASGHQDGVRGAVHGLLERALVQAQLGLGEPQPPPLDGAAVLLEVPEPTAQPADGDRALTTVEVLMEQPRRAPSRPSIVPRRPERDVGPLAGGDRLVGPAQPPGGLRQRLQLHGPEVVRVASGEIRIHLEPGPHPRGLPRLLCAGWLLHGGPPPARS